MWDVYSYGGGDFIRMIFNGIAMMFGNDDYKTAIVIAALIGLLSVMITAAFKQGELNIQWLIAVIFIYQIAFVPKVDVIIIDEVIPANSAVVSNVPLGVGAPAAIFSQFSHWLTNAFETVFSMPTDLSFRDGGLLFAGRLVEASTQFEFTDPRVNENYAEFWKSCVYYDILLNRYSWSQLLSSPDIDEFIGTNTSVTRAFAYANSSGDREILNCNDGYNNQLAADYKAEIAAATNIHGTALLDQEPNKDKAILRFSSAMPLAFKYMTGISKTNAEIVGQNAMANSLKRGLMNFASEADAPAAAQDFALARAEQERKTSFLTLGEVAKKMLPILQHLFEAFIYAMFPIVMLMAMTPMAGKVAMGYGKALLWVNLWPPLYAILHFAMSYYQAAAGQAAMVVNGTTMATGLSILNNNALGKVMEEYAAIAGYLSISIPMIAWLVVSMSGAMMAGMAGRLMSGYEQPVSRAAEEATSGISMGNASYMNTNAFQEQSSPTMDSGNIDATRFDGANEQITAGGSYIQGNQSSGAVDISSSEAMTKSAESGVTQATSAVNTTTAQVSEANSSVLNDSNAIMEKLSTSNQNNSEWAAAEKSQNSMASTEMEQAMKSYSQENTEADMTAVQAGVSAQATAGFGAFGSSASVTASASATTGHNEAEVSKEMEAFTGSKQYAEATTAISEGVQSLKTSFGTSEDDSAFESLDASLTKQSAALDSQAIAVSNLDSASETLKETEQFSETFKTNDIDAVRNNVVKDGGSAEEFNKLYLAANTDDQAKEELFNYMQDNGGVGMVGNSTANLNQDDLAGGGDQIMQNGTEAQADLLASGNQGVNQHDNANRGEVAGQVGEARILSSDENDQVSSSRMNNVQQTMDNPDNAHNPNRENVQDMKQDQSNINDLGQNTKDRVNRVTPDFDKEHDVHPEQVIKDDTEYADYAQSESLDTVKSREEWNDEKYAEKEYNTENLDTSKYYPKS